MAEAVQNKISDTKDEKVATANGSRRTRASGESGVLLTIVAGALVVGNIALAGTALRYDSTREKRFSLSQKGTAKLLSTLKKPLQIKVYAPEGLASIDVFVRDLRDLLSEYARYGSGKVNYEVIIPDRLEGEEKIKAMKDAEDAGLRKQLLGQAANTSGQATISEGFLGIVLFYGGEKTLIDQQDGLDPRNPVGLEFVISNKIRELRDKEDKIEHKIGFLQGHKERGYQELSQIFGKYFPYYKFESIDLSKGDKEVDATLDGLIITQPEEEITVKELRRINQFVMKGKALAVFANTLYLKDGDAAMSASFAPKGVEKLLSGYGIDYKNEFIIDRAQFWTPMLAGPQGLGLSMDPYPFVLVADSSGKAGSNQTYDSTKFPPFFHLPQLAVPFPIEITIDKARAGGDGVKIENVLTTSPNIVTVQGINVSLHPNPQKLGNGASGQKGENRKAILGVHIEGKLKSAFPTEGDGVNGVPAMAEGNARLFVVSSQNFLGNPFKDAGKSPFAHMMQNMDPNTGADQELMRFAQIYERMRIPSLIALKQTCDWISQETDLLEVSAKLLAEPELTYPKSQAPVPSTEEKIDSESFRKKKQKWLDEIRNDQKTTQWANILVGPSFLGLFGLFRWWRRNTTRASVKI